MTGRTSPLLTILTATFAVALTAATAALWPAPASPPPPPVVSDPVPSTTPIVPTTTTTAPAACADLPEEFQEFCRRAMDPHPAEAHRGPDGR